MEALTWDAMEQLKECIEAKVSKTKVIDSGKNCGDERTRKWPCAIADRVFEVTKCSVAGIVDESIGTVRCEKFTDYN